MTEAYIYDAVRTPRGKGKSDGSLHEITPVDLAAQVLAAVRDRNNIDSAEIEDVAMGCVSRFGKPVTRRLLLAFRSTVFAPLDLKLQILQLPKSWPANATWPLAAV